MTGSRSIVAALVGVATLATAVWPPGAAAQAAQRGGPAATRQSNDGYAVTLRAAQAAARGDGPVGVNPYLAEGNPAGDNYASWRYNAAARSARRAPTGPPAPIAHAEVEPPDAGGRNDTIARAERIRRLGTRQGAAGRATVTGSFFTAPLHERRLPAAPEDNGAVQLAADTGVSQVPDAVRIPGTIGDGPYGSTGTGTGDFDWYRLAGAAGDSVDIEVTTPGSALNPLLVLVDEDLQPVMLDLDLDDSGDARLVGRLPADGTYTLGVGGCCAPDVLQADPADPASGPGVSSEGSYDLLVALPKLDADAFSVDLARGDVVGATVNGPASGVDIYDPAGRLVMGGSFDAGLVYPPSTPLPHGGAVTADHVASTAGRHTVVLRGRGGSYTAELAALRPGREARPAGSVQTIFLDVDGETLDTTIFGGTEEVTLSPLATFLAGWGLSDADAPAVVAVMADTVRQALNRARLDGGNRASGVRVVTGADGAARWGEPDVSRVVIGGTIEQFGLPTVGLAQSIDPGNFASEESAVVLLDLLSSPAGRVVSINTYLGAGSDRVEFVGRVLGTIAAHEAAHYLGNWHTRNDDPVTSVTDQGGGDIGAFFGVGPDRIGGTADDRRVILRPGPLTPNEGLFGTEDTPARTSWGLSIGRRR